MIDDTRGEPPGGWVTGPELVDTELLVTTLCRFAGSPVRHQEPCPVRLQRLHPDVECRALFFQAEALHGGLVQLDGFDELPEEVRQHWPVGGAPIGTSHG